ncbi:hypothetical protein NC651_023842 [Populus alba x Populus x berolinensis]|nr:hypothetical protein NC651_023842 [Populus alba x Populus x berolinensis]
MKDDTDRLIMKQQRGIDLLYAKGQWKWLEMNERAVIYAQWYWKWLSKTHHHIKLLKYPNGNIGLEIH